MSNRPRKNITCGCGDTFRGPAAEAAYRQHRQRYERDGVCSQGPKGLRDMFRLG